MSLPTYVYEYEGVRISFSPVGENSAGPTMWTVQAWVRSIHPREFTDLFARTALTSSTADF